jgi:poly-gamma-glutamate synthesis protein (capsule biosynthesis protein)
MRKKSDIVIVSFHWGTEYTDTITERQKYLAHVAIDSGADLILGNHPHWIQPVEVYKNKLIVYSHGSLIFNQDNFELAKKASEQTKIGIMGKYYFADNKIVGVEFIPIKINSHNQPHFMEAKDSREILRKIEEKSYQLLK